MVKARKSYFIIALLLFFLGVFPNWAGDFLIASMIQIFLYLAVAEMWSFMAGHAGMVSLGQQMFIGLGGYGVAILSMYYGLPPWLSVLVAGFVGSVVAATLTFPLLRLRGVYFAIGSWIVAEIMMLFFNSWEFVGAGKGLVFKPAHGIPVASIYYPAVVLGLASIFTVHLIHRSKLGFGLRAIGSDEDAASEVGVNVFRCKAYCFIIASLLTTLAGGINCLYHAYLRATAAFGIQWTINFLFISVIGGIGTLVGPIIGSVIFVALNYFLAQYIGLSLLLQGVIALIILMSLPEGIWGVISRKLGLTSR